MKTSSKANFVGKANETTPTGEDAGQLEIECKCSCEIKSACANRTETGNCLKVVPILSHLDHMSD
jgi:hypothetical protein